MCTPSLPSTLQVVHTITNVCLACKLTRSVYFILETGLTDNTFTFIMVLVSYINIVEIFQLLLLWT